MLRRTFSTLTAFVCTAVLASAARAAEFPPTISGTGEASVRIVPTKLRMQVQVEAHGKTAELAIERLRARREAVAENLRAIGTEKESIKFGDPSVNKVAPVVGPANYTTPTYPTPVMPYAPPAPSGFVPSLPPPGYAPAPSSPSAPALYPPPSTPPTTSSPSSPVSAGPTPYPPPGTTFTPASSPSRASPDAPEAGPAPGAVPTITPAAAPSPPMLAPAPVGSPPPPPRTDDPFSEPAVVPTPTPYAPVSPDAPTPPVPPVGPSGPTVLPPAVQQGAFPGPAIQPRAYPHPSLDFYAATATLTVEWPLKAETVEQAVLAGEAVRKRVEAADLMGGKAAEKLPDDEQELLDEPSFVYVATISSQQRKAVLAEAFGNAKSQAAELAEAAGGKLGTLQNVSGEVSNAKPLRLGTVSPPTISPNSVPTLNENDGEATAADPAGMKFYAKVWASFRLQ